MQFVDSDLNDIDRDDAEIDKEGCNFLHCHESSFISLFPNESREFDRIRCFGEDMYCTSVEPIDWLDIGTYTINEYNTDKLLDMAFPTLFPTGDDDWLYPHIFNVEMHEYGLHLLRYYDPRFGSHPQF